MRASVLALAVAACSSSKDTPPKPAPEPTLVTRVVPLGVTTGDDPLCARMVTELVKHSNWSLQVMNQANDRFLIHHDGTISWHVKGLFMPERTLTLLAGELAQLEAFGDLSCDASKEPQRTYTLAWGPSDVWLNPIGVTSPLGNAIDKL